MPYSREELLAEARRRGLTVPSSSATISPQYSRDELLAEARRRGLTVPSGTQVSAPAQMTPAQTQAAQSVPEYVNRMRQGQGPLTNVLNSLGQFGEGLRRAGEGFAQTGLQVGNYLGLTDKNPDEFTRNVEARRRLAPYVPEPTTIGGSVARFAGEVAPTLAVPPIVKGGALASAAGNALINAGIGATEFTPEGGSKLKQAALGGTFGAAGEFGLRRIGNVLSPKASTKQMIKAFEEAGTTPSVGQATGSKFLQGVENSFSGVLGGQGISARAAARAQKELGDAAGSAADRLATRSTDELAGGIVRKGLHAFTDDFKANAEVLYSKIGDKIAPDQPVSVKNTLDTMKELTTTIPGAERIGKRLVSNEIKTWAKDLSKDAVNGNLPFEALQGLRSKIGAKLNSSDLISDIPKGQLKRIYGALSEDLKTAAMQNGAEKEWSRANKYYRAGSKRIDDFLNGLAKKTQDIDIYRDLVSAGNKGAQKINAVKRSLPPRAWETFVGTKIKEMGLTTPGRQGAEGVTFSSDVFLMNWNRMNSQAKKALLSGSQELKNYGKNLDNLAKIAERIKESAKPLSNLSGTANRAVSLAAQVGGLSGAAFYNPKLLLLGAGVIAGSAGIEKLMTSPKTINIISSIPSDLKASQVAAILGRGSAIYAAQDDSHRAALDNYIRQNSELEKMLQ
jgi:hypothetical protein